MQGRNREDRPQPGVKLRPYYERGGIALYHGECVDLLPQLAAQHAGRVTTIVTSPPYAEQRKKTYGGIPEAEYPQWTVGWMDAAAPLLCDDASVIVNIREHRNKRIGMSDYVHRTRMAVRAGGWFEVDEMIWVKPSSFPGGNIHLPRASWERLLWFSRVSVPQCNPRAGSQPPQRQRTFEGAQLYAKRIGHSGASPKPGYINKPPKRPNYIIQNLPGRMPEGHHPARYPIGLAEQIVTLFGDFVVDPFAGAFTTGVACLRTGRRCIGIERMESYCELAARRLDREFSESEAKAA